MDETTGSIFQSFWRLILAQLTEVTDADEKLLKDMFSSTFAKAFETAPVEERSLFISTLDKKIPVLAKNPVEVSCLEILVAWLSGQSANLSTESVFLDSLFNENTNVPEKTLFEQLESPLVTRVLSGMDPDMQARFVEAVERSVLPRISTDAERSRLLSSCPALASEIESFMTRTIKDIVDWFVSNSPSPSLRVSSQLELALSLVQNSPRILLFKQMSNIPKLKEQFMVTLAVALRQAAALGIPVDPIKYMFFFVPSLDTVVMDRWLDKELAKYNKDVLGRVKQFKAKDLLRDILIATCFPKNDEEWVPIPFGPDAVIATFIENNANEDQLFKPLPCALSADSAASVLKLFPTVFEVSGDNLRARLTPAGLSLVKKTEKDESSKILAPTSMPDDLIDILLREILNKLPQHAFLSRPYPSKVRAGVYRFGTREVTFHAKGGVLFVFRVGGYVSESEAADFIAREFGVKIVSSSSSDRGNRRMGSAPPPLVSTRRPMEWENERFLQRLVKRGIKAKDPVWRESWEALCGAQSSADPRNQGKEILAKFIEQNLAHATKQTWAKDLLYYVDKNDHSSGLESDDGRIQQNISTTSFKPPSETHPNYRTRLCVNFPLGRCTRGAACAYAHGEAELRALGGSTSSIPIMQGQFYKTRLCNAFLEGRCTRGAACSYAHSEEERLAYAGGVVKRDAKAGQDIRLEEKRKALAKARGRSASRSRSRSRSRRDNKPVGASKPLPFIPGRKVDETDL